MSGSCITSDTNVIIENNIEKYADCKEITHLTLGSSVTTVPTSFFVEQKKIQIIEFQHPQIDIQTNSFLECTSLSTLIFQKDLSNLGANCFSMAPLTKIEFKERGERFFVENDFLIDKTMNEYRFYLGSSTDLQAQNRKIREYCFSGNYRISKVLLKNISGIGTFAFYRSSLSSINIPSSVLSIGDGLFYWCNSLSIVTVEPNSNQIESFLRGKMVVFKNCIFWASVDAEDPLTFPDTVERVVWDSVARLKTVETIKMNEKCLSCDQMSIRECTKLKNVLFPSKLKIYARRFLSDCPALKEIHLPTGLTTINYEAFCAMGLEKLVIPSSVTNIGQKFILSCVSLRTITFLHEENMPSLDENSIVNAQSLKYISVYCNYTNSAIPFKLKRRCQSTPKFTHGRKSSLKLKKVLFASLLKVFICF